MLQWTGGSRRKVTTSRKSTQNRQKQYFEHRKRQQQTPGLESYADGSNKCAQYHESRSLDILSLINLARVAQECRLGRTIDKLREGPDVCASQVGNQVLKYAPTTLKSKIIHGDSAELKESNTRPSVHEAERISPKKAHAFIGPENVWPSENCSSNTRAVKRDKWGTTTENLSVLDLLSDDGSHGNSEGRSVHEAHVAFSVEGLGKIGMETPVHSPREVGRNFFNGLSPPKAGRRFPSKNHKYIMDDLDRELSSIIHDIGMPLNGNSSELLSNSRCIPDHSVYSKNTNLMSKGHMPLDGYGGPKDDFLDQEENFYTDTKEKIEQPWNGKSDFLDRNFLGEWHFGVAWKNEPFQMNSETAKLVRANEQEMFDYGFDDFYVLNGRDEEQEHFKFSTLDSPAPYFKRSAPKNDYEFKAFDEERCPAGAESWDFKSMSNQHAWTYLEKDDLMNSFSSLSEESCSSSAVKGVTTSSLRPAFMKLNRNKINHGNEVWRSSRNQHNRKNLYAEKTACKNWDEILREKHLKGVGISLKAPNLSRCKTDHILNDHSAIQAISELPYGSVFDGECTSVDVDSPLSPFCRTSVESDTTSLDYKFGSEDLLCSFPNPKLDSNPESSCKRSKFSSPIDFPPSRSFFSEKDVLQKSAGVANSYDPLIFSDIGSRLRKPNVHLASNLESQPPCSSFVNSQRDKVLDLLVQLNDSKDDEDESEFQPTACGITSEEPQKEVSVGNNDLSSENESNVVAADMKDNSSEHKEVKDGTLEPVNSPKTRNYDECVEEVPAEEIPEKLDSCNNDKQFHSDPGASVHSQNDSKGIDIFPPERRNTGNKRSSCDESSYQVMLESYVLQLLCVQKVLKGASE